MKKLFVLICLSLFTFGYSQEKVDFKKNEIKGNALFLVLGAVEITYERLLTDDSGLGASLFVVSEEDFNTSFSLAPYYRAYFGKKPAAGFFVEGFSMIDTGIYDDRYLQYDSNTSQYVLVGERTKYVDFALGFGLGSKWVHKKGYVFEINAGIGRNLFNNNSPELVGRGGIILGYRF